MMDWILVLVDFGCMVFLAKSIMEHTYFVREVQPQIDALIERAEAFEAKGEVEAGKRNEVRARLPELREAIRTTERETEAVRRSLQHAFTQFEQLENLASARHFKQGVKDGRRAAVPGAVGAAAS
jgi:chromosome segregation ATPase